MTLAKTFLKRPEPPYIKRTIIFQLVGFVVDTGNKIPYPIQRSLADALQQIAIQSLRRFLRSTVIRQRCKTRQATGRLNHMKSPTLTNGTFRMLKKYFFSLSRQQWRCQIETPSFTTVESRASSGRGAKSDL
jgi:hypothetical protein